MAEDSIRRKLTAILCADAKGYSRMICDDEVGTYQTLTANLESIRSIISRHKGHVFSSTGDACRGLLLLLGCISIFGQFWALMTIPTTTGHGPSVCPNGIGSRDTFSISESEFIKNQLEVKLIFA